MGRSAISGINLGVPGFRQDFTVGPTIVVNHGLNSQYVDVTVYDNNDLIIIPDDVTATDADNLLIDITSYGSISGTWKIIVIDKGATQSVIPTASNLNLAGQTTDDVPIFNGSIWVAQAPAAASAIAFYVTANGSQINIPLGLQQVQFANTQFDIGLGNPNVVGNVFTAPIAGYYQFNSTVVLRNMDISAASYQTYIRCVGSGVTNSTVSAYDVNTQSTADVTGDYSLHTYGVLFLPLGGTADVTVTMGGGGAAQTDIDGAGFSGHYIGA